jgi:hypothetical protein
LITGKIDLIEELNPVSGINNESAEEGIEDEKDNSNIVVPNKKDDVIYFENYNVKKSTVSNKAEIDFSSNEGATHFKKRIVEAYKTNEIDFAGHYVGVIFGCGADCISGFFIDVLDGKIYNAPLGEEYGCIFSDDKAIYKADSRLFITAICHSDSQKGKKYYISSLWNEQKKIFEEVKEQKFLSKK